VYARPDLDEGGAVLDLDEAFFALEQLDAQGRKALVLAGMMWEELYRDALAQADKSKYLLERLHKWAADWGLTFDMSKASAPWEAPHDRPLAVLSRRYYAQLSERTAELEDLRARLDDALDGREQAEIRAEQAERALLHLRHRGKKP
jgi:hypothetical protein